MGTTCCKLSKKESQGEELDLQDANRNYTTFN